MGGSAIDKNSFNLKVGGLIYSGWQSVRITRAIDKMVSDFDVTVAERWAGHSDVWQIQPFSPCTLAIGNNLVLTGFVDSYLPGYSEREHHVRIAGRSLTQDIVDCTPDIPGGQFSGYRLDAIAGAIAQLYGIRVHVLTDVGAPFPDATIERHETGFQFLERLARLRSVLLTDDEFGNLVLTTAGATRSTDGLVQGSNIKSASSHLSGVKRFSEYRVKSVQGVQTALPGLTSISPPPVTVIPPTQSVADQFLTAVEHALANDAPQTQVATSVQGVAYDPGVPRFRPHVVIAESSLDAAGAQRRALWQAKHNAARSVSCTVETAGWRQTDGNLWKVNQVVSVKSPFLQINMELLCAELTFELSPDRGRITRMVLGPVDGYQPDPGQVRVRKHSNSAPIYGSLTSIATTPPK